MPIAGRKRLTVRLHCPRRMVKKPLRWVAITRPPARVQRRPLGYPAGRLGMSWNSSPPEPPAMQRIVIPLVQRGRRLLAVI
ncbi:MAG: hypothetical protein KKE86_14460 [Planctomycetes bacterium]|nr:hypothetical protein [Planctomycetota bacterium]MBU4400522.1 hypothetical protein [Planctomycetota bacterium]MCG2683129.1 hypothetical protein [Planctomycetales bacterium]